MFVTVAAVVASLGIPQLAGTNLLGVAGMLIPQILDRKVRALSAEAG